jgi:hypothetical protein
MDIPSNEAICNAFLLKLNEPTSDGHTHRCNLCFLLGKSKYITIPPKSGFTNGPQHICRSNYIEIY